MFSKIILALSSAVLVQAAYLLRHDGHEELPFATASASGSGQASILPMPFPKANSSSSVAVSLSPSTSNRIVVTATEYTTVCPTLPTGTGNTTQTSRLVFPYPGSMGSARYPTSTASGGLSCSVGTGTGKVTATAVLPSLSGAQTTRASSPAVQVSAPVSSSPASSPIGSSQALIPSKPAVGSNSGFAWPSNLSSVKTLSSKATSTTEVDQPTSTSAVVIVPVTPTDMALQARHTSGVLPQVDMPNITFVQKGDDTLNDELSSVLEQARGPEIVTLWMTRTTTKVAASTPPSSSDTPPTQLSSRPASPTSTALQLLTSILPPHPKCPYPYPGVTNCGGPQTILVPKVTSTTTSTTTNSVKTGKEKETGWCPYPGRVC